METLKRFESAHRRVSVAAMRACFHDDALIESVASDGRPLDADRTVEALREALADGVYAIGDWQYEELEPTVVLSSTGARHRLADARIRDEMVFRLIVGRDGLMWRVKLFHTREEALGYLAEHRSELGI
ncbi:MAG TPA: hypothetical protein VGM80_12360 [Gaiellaceae bacterium]|jgi:hypothetical protein